MIHQRKILKAIAYAILLCFTSLTGAQPLYAIPANTQLPTGEIPKFGIPDGGIMRDDVNNVMTINQGDNKTSVIEWGNFSIGADAAVNFKGPDGFNSLNYVANGGPISEIYGQLTALGGNIFIANPAGVQIGNSAQINVGSLYVTNKDIGEALEDGTLTIDENTINVATELQSVAATNAELMSLGAIVNAEKVTFDGGRIVLDTDRIYADNTEGELQPVDDAKLTGMLNIITTDKDNVVLGYTKDDNAGGFDDFGIKVADADGNIQVATLDHGYTWVHDLDELRKMNEDTSGWYALRNSIDANATVNDNFSPIGSGGDAFKGRFDGLGYSIFGLNVNVKEDTDAAGLFGFATDAHIKNFTLNGGKISGSKYVGAVAGSAMNSTIENITNTASVSGKGGEGDNGIGGIVGYAGYTTMSGLINIGTITGEEDSVNVGGIVGNMLGGTLTGETYNLGSVTGDWNIGGIAGQMTYGAKIGNDGDDAFQIYNQLNIDGEYNVGGIAGYMYGSTITNAANHGNITAEGYTNDTYKYHTAAAQENLDGARLDGNLASIAVNAANAGGIAGAADGGASVTGVINDGDVTSTREGGDNHYKAGNVGGIVGRAEDTTITNAENKENTVAGAHNVGGVAGFLGGVSSVEVGVNNGGDITATGARKYSAVADDPNGYAKERVRPIDGNELFNIGNIGGIVGYLFGDSTKVKNSGNRGTVQSAKIDDANNVPETAKAANVGGVVGKIDMETPTTLEAVKKDAHANYKDGVPTILNSYSTGEVRGYTGVGGVAGMMYNGSIAGSYNLGTVNTTRQVDNSGGDIIDPLNMGGVVGDTTEQTDASAVLYDVYNAGQIGDETYKYFARHVGGIAGRLSGYIDKAYNTGNIYNNDTTVGGIVGWWYNGNISNVFNTGNITVRANTELQAGGIVGAASDNEGLDLSYAYNLGTIRGFQDNTVAPIMVGGIIGRARGGDKTTINNVYTLGNIYAARLKGDGYKSTPIGLGAIYGVGDRQRDANGDQIIGFTPILQNANYITPENTADDSKPKFEDLSKKIYGQDIRVVEYDNRSDTDAYELEGLEKLDTATGWSVNEGAWRLYEGGTPILNAFTPYAEDYFSANHNGISSIQYGTAYNPMLTIVNIGKDSTLEVDWQELNMKGAGGLAVYGGGLTLTDFQSAGDGRYFGGTIFSEGKLNITGTGTNFNLGSASKLYGSSVKLNANGGDISAYGEVTSTNGNIEVSGKNVEIIGSLTAKAEGETTEIDGISGASTTSEMDTTNLNDPNKAMKSVSDMFTYTTDQAKDDGNISVEASGAAEVLYGNLGTGSVSTEGNFTVNGGVQEDGTLSGGSVYVDSDLSGTTGNINLSAGGEVLLDITNIAKANESAEDKNGAGTLHTFLDNYSNGTSKITLDSANDDEIIAIDMWDDGKFYLDKYNDGDETFVGAIQALGEDLAGKTHIWISDANQLKGIQTGETTKILNYNFALKGNIDASALEDYKAIGGEAGYSGTFDGRDFRIIGLNSNVTDTSKISSGIFGTLTGTVKDLRVYASKFFGGDGESAGAIASEVTEGGKITGVTTFGNTVTAEDGAAGGIAGENSGSILESTASDSVTASGENADAGGVAGVNTGSIGEKGEEGESAQITADSAVRSGANGAAAIGGVVGKNDTGGKVWLANSLGVTTGAKSEATGGIAGTNRGEMTSLYNESIVTGGSSVGGVAGDNSGTMTNAVNATRVTGTGTNTGGLVGNNSGTVDSGRNAGVITGKTSVGGMVGSNGEKGILKNLSNAIVAAITGNNYVGGIAGSNAGSITSDNNLTNEGTVSGHTYVGGIAGVNTKDGTIENVLSETLVLKTGNEEGAQYFGGIAGQNSGAITNATNNSNVRADGATFVGGIVGENTLSGELEGKLINYGDVSGESNVGGLAGSNAYDDLLKGTENDYITAENHGEVKADAGSAGGIFYENKGDIEYANLTNTGTVIGTGQANTGGLFGINNGDISNSKLTNSGTVTGGDNTGGLIGSNSGNVSNSSLINTVDAKVTGGDNTGGLIGYNTGTIKGGRNDAYGKDLGLYTYKIYNNGTVSGASNVGGLIGNNAQENGKTGSLIAGYNTGVVTGSGENVGGIAGTNEGTIDQVFNTIMTGINDLGETVFGAVTGKANVGGIVGSNTGKLTNAYNTTGVTGTTNIGNIVGKNSGTVKNVYATNETGTLVGDGNAKGSYSFSEADNEKEGITVIEPAAKNKQGSYEQFNFTGDSGTPAVWKIYEGKNGQEASGTPLLKVFLTKAEYSDETSFTYNGKNQGLSLDGVTVDGEKLSDVAKTLLSALEGKNAYNGYLGFTSEQIAGSTTMDGDGNVVFNPNNLGYDIDATFDIDKATLNISLNEVNRVYGNGSFTNGTNYGYTIDSTLTVEMEKELAALGFDKHYDKAVDGLADGRTTNDAGTYEWSADFTLEGDLAKNYEFAGSTGAQTTIGGGVSRVDKAKLTINVGDVSTTYGTAFDKNKYGYTLGGLVNGDSDGTLRDEIGGVEYTNDAALNGSNGKWTANAGDYENAVGIESVGELANYNIVAINKGDAHVGKADLTINVGDVSTTYGTAFDKSKYGYVLSGLANGDSDGTLRAEIGGVEYTNDAALNGSNGKWTANAGDYENAVGIESVGELANYNIVAINKGDAHVGKADLTINVGDASTTYGTAFDESKYGYVLSGLVNGDSDGALRNEIGGVGYTNDAALDGSNGKWTANAGDYENAVGIDSIDSLANYTIKINNGNATVNKASLTVNANDASAVYGSDSWNYGYKLDGLANGDTAAGLSEELSGIKYDNTAAFDGTNGKYTADAGRYEGAISVNLTGVDLKNYAVVAGNKGTAAVTPAKLTITADDQSVLLGTRPEYTGTAPADLGNQLVNGDSLDGFSYIFGVADTGLETEIGRHEGVIGLFAGGHFYGGGTHDLSTLSSVFRNYDVTVDAGTLTISAGDNFGHLHWLHRGGERVRNFRERKAEIYFHEGGMVHEETM